MHVSLARLGLMALVSMVFTAMPCSAFQIGGSKIEPGDYNVLLIVLDDVGTDQLELYDEHPSSFAQYPPTPTLDALRNGAINGGGILFQRAYGTPLCSPTRACIQTGRYPFRTGCGDQISLANSFSVDSATEEFIPEVLEALSVPGDLYSSGAFGKWHLADWDDPVVTSGDLSLCHPVKNGYDIYEGMLGNPDHLDPNFSGVWRGHYDWEKVTVTPSQCGSPTSVGITSHAHPHDGPFDRTTFDVSVNATDALNWIKATSEAEKKPFFAYLALSAPHTPVEMPPAASLSSTSEQHLYGTLNGTPVCSPCCPNPALLPIYPAVNGSCSGSPVTCINFIWGTAATASCPFEPGERPDGNQPAPGGVVPTAVDCDNQRLKLTHHAMIEAIDKEIGILVNGLDPEVLAQTMIIVMGDNGSGPRVMSAPQDPLHSKGRIFDGGIRVPMIASGPLVPTGGHESFAFVAAVDVFSTVLEFMGLTEANIIAHVTSPAPHQLDSISFLDVVRNPTSLGNRDHIYSETFSNAVPPITAPEQRCVISWIDNVTVNGVACTPGIYKFSTIPINTCFLDANALFLLETTRTGVLCPADPLCETNNLLGTSPCNAAIKRLLKIYMDRYDYANP